MILVGATDEVVQPPVEDPGPSVQALSWTWTAPWMERTWDLTDLRSPVLKLRGATGTGQVAPTHWWSEAPAVDGAAWMGSRVGSGEVFLPLQISGESSSEFLVNHDEFMSSLDPRQEGILQVTRPDGEWREIACRYSTGADAEVDLDPVKRRHVVYGITWTTADPYWSGEEVEETFVNPATSAGFYPGPPFTLGPGQTLGNATTVNPGDVESYPLWRIDGPFTSFTLGVGDSLVELALVRATGQYIEINMHPRKLTILDQDGVDQWDSVTDVAFSSIPPRLTKLNIVVLGTGPGTEAQLSFTPRYRRAW